TPPATRPAADPLAKAEGPARFVADQLLPRASREPPALGTPASTGIDGVSLGGRAALGIGLLRPNAFAVVASMQAALRVDNSDDVLHRARAAKSQKPDLYVRLLTSDDDYFLKANRTVFDGLIAAGIHSDFLQI